MDQYKRVGVSLDDAMVMGEPSDKVAKMLNLSRQLTKQMKILSYSNKQ